MAKYFTIGEFTKSRKADEHGITNRLPKEYLPNVQNLIEKVLDPLREAYGKPITVDSGYRCPELNRLVGGSQTSDHMNACAADIHGHPNTPEENEKIFRLAKELKLPFDQLIDEYGYRWIHISHRSDGRENRGMIFSEK